MKHFEDVKKELTKGGIDWVLGTETGWSDNSLIFDGGDCKILLYVEEDEKGNLSLIYHDLFEEGEYSPIFDNTNEETTTSYRGMSSSVKDMLKKLDLI
jgi:hypothetical protein